MLCYGGCHYTTQYSRDQHLPAKTEHKQYNTLNTLWRPTRKNVFLSPSRLHTSHYLLNKVIFIQFLWCLFYIYFGQLKKIYSSETISGFEESQELPLKFEDIVDKYYDKMRPPRTGGKNDQIINIIT